MSDLAILAADPTALDLSGDPATFVVLACERAKDWLTQAVEHGDIDQIVELKSQAEAIRIYTTQKQLGKDAELAAAEIVRRAERGIGVAIRRGQEAGEIAKQGDVGGGGRAGSAAAESRRLRTDLLESPSKFLPASTERTAVYAVTDNVTDEQFEEAITEAKDEGNLSRANVVRKVVSHTPAAEDRRSVISTMAAAGNRSSQIAEHIGVSEERVRELARNFNITLPDAIIGKRRRIDPDRVVNETVTALEGLVMALDLIWEDFDRLDQSKLDDWTSSLSTSIRQLNRLNKQLKERVQ